MRLYIIRHADPDYPNNTITDKGHVEARALAERMEAEGITKIYCSPMGRALHTMQYTIERMGLPFGIEEWTQELGLLDFQHPERGRMMIWDIEGEIIRASSPLPDHENWRVGPPMDTPKVREVFAKVAADSDAFLARHGYIREGGRYRIITPNRERIAIFCHGGFGLTWLAHLLALPLPLVWSGFHLAPTSVTIILFDERSKDFAVPRCLALSDTSHLYKSGLPIQPRGIKANYY
ncbi:MAG TPA: histidine phosphatase family protein [Candidatus Brocadiia bacterium]|nr:histidine phosphatase family protein [Candidatus Brocadiia bacterium]